MPDEESAPPGVVIDQGYLVVEDDLEIRVRRAGHDFTLTLKHGHGESRGETELGLTEDQFNETWPLTAGRRVGKTRNRIELEAGLVAEVDSYRGDLDGLTVVEVEFDTPERAAGFEPPSWFGREVTGDRAWANQSLALNGRPKRKLEFRLRPGEDPGPGIARVVAARSAQAAAAVRQAAVERDPGKQIHDARKSLKKARSALRLLKGVIPDEERRRANGTLRAAGAELSGARDAEVKIATLDAVTATRSAWPGLAPSFESLESEANTLRNRLSGPRLAGTANAIEEVRRVFAGREIEVEPEVIAENLARTYRRGNKARKRASEGNDAEDFHDWRKRTKDLRYQLEILRRRLPDEYKETRRLATRLADQLGDLHDLDVLLEDLKGRGLDPEVESGIESMISLQRKGAVESSLRLGRDAYSIKPGRFGKAFSDEA